MSGGRRTRRRLGQAARLERRGDVELSAATRALVARINAGHDDPDTSSAEFVLMVVDATAELERLSTPERIEASLQIGEHAASRLAGRPLRGYLWPRGNQ